MKGTQVVLGHLWGREAAALMVDGRIEDLALDASALTPLPPGAVCRAVVDRLVKGQGGVFLRLPEGQRGFLREARGLAEGQSLIVQVTGVAEDGKALRGRVLAILWLEEMILPAITGRGLDIHTPYITAVRLIKPQV